MTDPERLSLVEIAEFLAGSEAVTFQCRSRAERYGVIVRVLKAHPYGGLGRKEKGFIRRYLSKLTGLSLGQLTRLIGRWRRNQTMTVEPYRRPRFPRRYRPEDIALLAQVDEAHEGLSGAAIRHILQREFRVYGRTEFARLAEISVSHIYNLRATRTYKMRRVVVEPTESQTRARWGVRRKPEPEGAPGWLRVDTVHQGNQDGERGPYHVNAVDAVTQWEVMACCQTLSARELELVVRRLVEQFPFPVRGFHSDNGHEFVNREVAKLLNEQFVEFTLSRPNRSSDNALVEGKNGAVVRKWMGWGMMGAKEALRTDSFFRDFLNPYVNFHRPSGFAVVDVNGRGRRRRRYPADRYRTPYEQLQTLPDWTRYLKPGVNALALDQQAMAHTDTQAAERVQAARNRLFAPALWPEVTPLLVRGKGLGPSPRAPLPENPTKGGPRAAR